MKIAIHCRPGSFSDRWIDYCKYNNIPYKTVNCYDTNIIEQLKDCDGLMWHWHHSDYRDILFARQLTLSLESIGKKVFPDSKTAWHFDDKVGQKYLLEAINAPLVKSYVFYERNNALEWSKHAAYPKVFKLRGGAGSLNVKLVRNQKQAKNLINIAFGRGFSLVNQWSILDDRYIKFKRNKNISSLMSVLKGVIRLIIWKKGQRLLPKQKGYIYFQDFIPNNKKDTRIVVVGERAFAITRKIRKNDFRASGSGLLDYNKNNIDVNQIKIAFETAKKLKSQCTAFDFIYDESKNPQLVEISYGFDSFAYDKCEGYWNPDLNWHNEKINPQYFIIEDFIKNHIT